MYNNPDVIIVGTGAAGLFCTLTLPRNLHILMITKDTVKNSDSFLAQGGIAALKNEDDFDSYYEDTMKAGHYENNPDSVKIMISSSPAVINDLITYGVDFTKKGNELSLTREGGHSTFRILHHDDITGKEITSKLLSAVQTLPNVEILEHTCMIDLIEQNHTCSGIVTRNRKGTIECIPAKAVVLATGGLGGLFEHSTNFNHLTGDSIALSLRHQIELQDINYIQIHPTTLYTKKPGRSFLISESVRGEGAILLNPNKERFVDELLPRDVVTAAIKNEMAKFHTDHVFLSLECMDKGQIIKRFPNIYKRCLEEGYHLDKEPIPITPAQHYFMGGVKVGLEGQTSMKRLYAVGETACNGVHGANRLASNSLLESLVFAKRAAKKIEENISAFTNIRINPAIITNYKRYTSNGLFSEWNQQNKKLILNEIKRRDCEFYDKWCNYENQCG